MDQFSYRNGRLHCEQSTAADIAERFGTPAYVYSRETLIRHYRGLRDAFAPLAPLICFSIKSCQNLHLLRVLADQGSGFDVVSGGELFRSLRVGADPASIVFAGVGKTEREQNEAIDARIGLFNIESEAELAQLGRVTRQRGITVRAALRVNPDVDPRTHAYTTTGKKETKFGVDLDRAARVFAEHAATRSAVHLCGIHMHIGSPVYEIAPYVQAIQRGVDLIQRLRATGLKIDTFDIGGGFGAHYRAGEAPAPADYAAAIVPLLAGRDLRVILEPGRTIAANAGVLLTRVLYTKSSGSRTFVIVDASMNELLRPALYGAYHFIWPVEAGEFAPATRKEDQPFDGLVSCDVVGPVCESSDFLAKGRALPPVKTGDLLAVFAAGAYAMTMSSQYNSRPRPPELLANGDQVRVIRRRETYEDLIEAEEFEA